MKSNDFMGRGGATERGDLWDILSRREHSEVCADESYTIAARLGGFIFRPGNPRRNGGFMQFFSKRQIKNTEAEGQSSVPVF